MQWRELSRGEHGRTVALVFARGDEVTATLSAWCREQEIGAAHFTAIGAFSDVTLGWFDWETKSYREIPLDEQVEVLTLAGDVALQDDEPAIHAHVVVGRSDGTTHGGHLLRAHVRPTLELILDESPAHLRKRHDPESGLALIAPDAHG
jgi:predicted DNA-binding protein with PD1-like motif